MKQRSLLTIVKQILQKKMVFLGGPRQCGKTTLAKSLLQNDEAYLNWDYDLDREKILKNQVLLNFPLLVFDEIHKYPRWRNWIKGYYDKFHSKTAFLVTGSARLDLYRRGGDSLQGRYRYLRLYPFTFDELGAKSHQDLMDLMAFSGFPEPLFGASETEARVWSREHRTRVIREDVLDLERVSEISLMEKLYLHLPLRVGSPLSINSLKEDIGVSFETAKRWVEIFERVYSIFRLYPYQNKKLSSLKKEVKHYHFDWTQIEDTGARFENLIAFHLLRHVHFAQDSLGMEYDLNFYRDLEKREVDFVVTLKNKPILFVEVKSSETQPTDALKYLKNKFPETEAIQVIFKPNVYENKNGIYVCSAPRFLMDLPLKLAPRG